MYKGNQSELTVSYLAITFALVAAALTVLPAISNAANRSASSSTVGDPARAQERDDSVPDEDAVPTAQVEKYIAVYAAMQKNHGLSVEQAASRQGLTVDQFRTLEDKIERNPIVHQRVLDALKASTRGGKAAAPESSKTK